jgi:hypothetical protein
VGTALVTLDLSRIPMQTTNQEKDGCNFGFGKKQHNLTKLTYIRHAVLSISRIEVLRRIPALPLP